VGRRARRLGAALALGGIAGVAAGGWALSRRATAPGYPRHLHGDYADGMLLARTLAELDGPDVEPACRSIVRSHGGKTDDVAVLLHGYTNCPAEFSIVADLLFESGWNVVVPRLPLQGLRDRMTDRLSELTVERLVERTALALDIASDIGERVTVAGISGGGALAAWAGWAYDDVDRVVMFSPFFGASFAPNLMVRPATRTARFLPDRYLWWDPVRKADRYEVSYAYPRFSLRGAIAYLQVAAGIQDNPSPRGTPLQEVVLVTNSLDPLVDNRLAARLLEEVFGGMVARRRHLRFRAVSALPHDYIDPLGAAGRRAPTVQPVIAQLVAGGEAAVRSV
jgi:acetyl esterase/lipase